MPEVNSGGSSNSPKNSGGKKEMSMEQRLLLAFGLMGVVLFLTQYLMPKPPVKPVEKPPTAATAPKMVEQPQAAPAPEAPAVAPGAPPPTQVAAQQVQEFQIETDFYRVKFTNKGAAVKSWVLKTYKDGSGKPLELINPRADKLPLPFSLQFKEQQKPSVDPNQALFEMKPAADGMGVDFNFVQGGTAVRKTFQFKKRSYLIQVSSSVMQNGMGIQHGLAWRGGFGDPSVHSAHSTQHAIYYNTAKNELVSNDYKAGKDGPIWAGGDFSFAGLQDTYFAAVFLPTGSNYVEVQSFSDPVTLADGKTTEPHVGASVGGRSTNTMSLYVGPKDIDVLKAVNPRLEQVVDWGWFGIIAKPLFQVLHWLNEQYIKNYGCTIIVLTVIINMVMIPLKLSSLKSMKRMQALQPRINAINDKYKGMSMKDPRKNQQNQELMDLYKEAGVNPAGGCLPMLLQLPFFFAFYKVLSVAIDLRGAEWLWVHDLSQPETLPIKLLPLLMIATQFWMQKMTPTTSTDPAQQKVMLLMPLMLGFMLYNASSGLVIYWLTGNVVGIAQQWFFDRMGSKPEPVPAVTGKKKGSK